MTNNNVNFWLINIGVVSIVGGIALVHIPSALIAFGVFSLAAGAKS